jgi:hypothetical protein
MPFGTFVRLAFKLGLSGHALNVKKSILTNVSPIEGGGFGDDEIESSLRTSLSPFCREECRRSVVKKGPDQG